MSGGIIVVAAVLGALLGPLAAGAAYRCTDPETGPGWWRGAGVPAGQLAATAAGCGLLAGAVAARAGSIAVVLAWCWLVLTGVALSITDLRRRRLPHPLTAALAVGGVLLLAAAAATEARWSQWSTAALAGLVVFATAAVVQLLFPVHTGGGDTALYGALAVYLGWFGWSGLLRGLFIATALTALVALAVWAVRGRTASFPAGPSLIAGTVIAVLTA
jgi:leader peptidase (prepilin peptidase)/N-methyltransferase